MEKLEKLKKEREELDKKIETLEYAERILEERDEVYYVDQFGNVTCGEWNDSEWVYSAFCQGHIFRTKQAAELEAKRRNLLTRFKAFRDECNGDWKVDWNTNDAKWSISKNEDRLSDACTISLDIFATFGYFKNQEDCKRAIELFGDEIKRLYVEVE